MKSLKKKILLSVKEKVIQCPNRPTQQIYETEVHKALSSKSNVNQKQIKIKFVIFARKHIQVLVLKGIRINVLLNYV